MTNDQYKNMSPVKEFLVFGFCVRVRHETNKQIEFSVKSYTPIAEELIEPQLKRIHKYLVDEGFTDKN